MLQSSKSKTLGRSTCNCVFVGESDQDVQNRTRCPHHASDDGQGAGGLLLSHKAIAGRQIPGDGHIGGNVFPFIDFEVSLAVSMDGGLRGSKEERQRKAAIHENGNYLVQTTN